MYVCMCVCVCVCACVRACIRVYIIDSPIYGVATISRLLKIIDLFCKRALEKRRYSAEETYNLRSLLWGGYDV